MEFSSSEPSAIGLEIEFQILDPETFDLADGIVPILEACRGNEHIKSEFAQSTVEVASGVCHSIPELGDDVRAHAEELAAAADDRGYLLAAAGTHPFYDGFAEATPDPRYTRMARDAGYVAHYDVTFASHVHIGVESRSQLIELTEDFRAFLPVFIALSANSPFWRGHRAGYATFRHIALAMGRNYGLPPDFGSWEDLSDFLERAERAGMADSICDFHWDVRPRPDLGTVELRTMDAFSTIAESVAFAAFVQALADYCRQTPSEQRPDGVPEPMPWWFERENFFQASRQALEADYIRASGETDALADLARQTLAIVRPSADKRGTEAYLDAVESLLERPGYLRQLEWFDETGTLRRVAERLAGLLDI